MTEATVGRHPRSRGSSGAVLATLLLAAALFPYITPIATPFDTQPVALFLAVIVLMAVPTRRIGSLPGFVFFLWVIVAVAVVSWIATGATQTGLRSVVSYLSVAAIASASALLWQVFPARIIPIASLVWASVGLVQKFAAPEFGSFLLPRLSTSAGRGVTSLAVEPSFFAVMCLSMLVLYDLMKGRDDWSRRGSVVVTCACTLGLLLAGSTFGLALAGVWLVARTVATNGLRRVAVGALAVAIIGFGVAVVYANLPTLGTSRVSHLASAANGRGIEGLLADRSVAERAFDVQASHLALFTSNGLGYGVGRWKDEVPVMVAAHPALGRYGVTEVATGRVMSGFGSAMFELGIPGLLLPVAFFAALRSAVHSSYRSLRGSLVGAGIGFAAVMEGAVPLAFPAFGIVFGALIAASMGQTTENAPVEQ